MYLLRYRKCFDIVVGSGGLAKFTCYIGYYGYYVAGVSFNIVGEPSIQLDENNNSGGSIDAAVEEDPAGYTKAYKDAIAGRDVVREESKRCLMLMQAAQAKYTASLIQQGFADAHVVFLDHGRYGGFLPKSGPSQKPSVSLGDNRWWLMMIAQRQQQRAERGL